MESTQELAFALKKLRTGFSLLLDSGSNFKNEEKQEQVLAIFNEDANKQYQDLFTYSFEEEVAELNEWMDNVILDIGAAELPPMQIFSLDNFMALGQGLQATSSALLDLETLTDKYPSLKTVVMSIENEHNQYSPFKIGVHDYRTKFDAFKWACFIKLEQILGPDRFKILTY